MSFGKELPRLKLQDFQPPAAPAPAPPCPARSTAPGTCRPWPVRCRVQCTVRATSRRWHHNNNSNNNFTQEWINVYIISDLIRSIISFIISFHHKLFWRFVGILICYFFVRRFWWITEFVSKFSLMVFTASSAYALAISLWFTCSVAWFLMQIKTWVGILSGKWKLEIVRCRNLGTLGIGGAISDYFLKDGKETISGMCLFGNLE